jgi:hypothetical protein
VWGEQGSNRSVEEALVPAARRSRASFATKKFSSVAIFFFLTF